MNKTCENCYYWEPITHHGKDYALSYGTCHRNAPQGTTADNYLHHILTAVGLLAWWTMREWSDEKTADKQMSDFNLSFEDPDLEHTTMWPSTEKDDWCGEWNPNDRTNNLSGTTRGR